MKKYIWHTLFLPILYLPMVCFFAQSACACLGHYMNIAIKNQTSSVLYMKKKAKTEVSSSPFNETVHLAPGQTAHGHICFTVLKHLGGDYELGVYRDKEEKKHYGTIFFENDNYGRNNPICRNRNDHPCAMATTEKDAVITVTLKDKSEEDLDESLTGYAARLRLWLIDKLTP